MNIFTLNKNRILTLENLTFKEWPALETQILGNWVLRFAQGYTKRSNSINCLPLNPVLGPSSSSSIENAERLSEAILHCEALYHQKNLPVIFKLTPHSQPEIEEVLEKKGYGKIDPSWVMTRPLQDTIKPSSSVIWHDKNDEVWLNRFFEWKDLSPSHRQLFATITALTEGEVFHATWEETPQNPVAMATGVLNNGWLGLLNVHTEEKYRGRGFAKKLIQAVLAEGKSRGATQAYLQVVEQNTPALGLYTDLGFQREYIYWYRVKSLSQVL